MTLEGPSGVLVVDKPRGPTSFDVVAQARRLLGTRRVGHCGTLDPMASGVLIVVVGEATKLASILTGEDKSYSATVTFGRNTDSLDAEGTTTELRPVSRGWLTQHTLDAALGLECARQQQQPPAFSAVRKDGQRAYALARQGITPDLPRRTVQVRSLVATAWTDDSVDLELTVSKGYYVRALARDLCQTLGVCGHLTRLRRTASGGFRLGDAIEWPTVASPELMTLEQAVARALPQVSLTPLGVTMARHGKALSPEHFVEPPPRELAAWLSQRGGLVALGRAGEDGHRVVRGFVARGHELENPND